MNSLDIILLLIISIILIFIIKNSRKSVKKNTIIKNNIDFDYDLLNSINKNIKIDENKEKIKFTKKNIKAYINPNFTEIQFHNDYRDTLTAFNNIAPSQKQIFNQENVPVKFTNPDIKTDSHVNDMISDFIKELNKNVNTSVGNFRHKNSSWDEAIPDPDIESGWDKQMKHLGIPNTIYNKPAKNDQVKLIKVDHIEMYETENQIKYTCFLILQKLNVDDQMIIKVSFVMNKNDVNIDRNFFSDIKDLDNLNDPNKDDTLSVIIEEIFIIGFLTNNEINEAGKDRDSFYNFSGLQDNEHISQKTIMKELMKKYTDRTKESNNFNATLDTEGRNFHRDLPHLRNYQAYQTTRTIFDDWSQQDNFS